MSFDPTVVSGLLWRLTASDPTTLTNDATAAGPAAGNITTGTTVGTWYDKQGYSSISQATTASQPTYIAAGSIGSKPCVRFPAAANGTGPLLRERAANLYTKFSGSHSILFLIYKISSPSAYGTILTNAQGGNQAEFLVASNSFYRFNGGASGASVSSGAAHALVYTYNASTSKESFYVDTAVAAAASNSPGRPGMTSAAFALGCTTDGAYSVGSEIYEVAAFDHELANTEVAQLFSGLNSNYGTSFNASAGTLAAPTISASSVGKTAQTVSGNTPSGGTSPYTYQWYRSTTTGSAASIAVSGNAISGATSLSYSDSGLTAQTTYYYVLKVTDAAATVALSTVLTAPTHGSTTVKIGLIGDSITVGAGATQGKTDPATQFGLAMQAAYPALDVQVTNYAQSGTTLRSYSRLTHAGGTNGGGGVTSLITTLNTAGITYLLMMYGTNDWGAGTGFNGSDATYTPANYGADVADVVSALTTAGITVYVNQLIYRSAGTNPDDATTGLPAFNAQLAALSYSSKLRQGDTTAYAYFKGNTSLLPDGLHPNDAGSTTLGQKWATANGPSIYSDVANTPVLTSITVAPGAATPGGTHTYTASGVDQFGNPFAITPVWTRTAGTGGSINSSTGQYTAPTADTITATVGTVSGTTTVITDSGDSMNEAFPATGSPTAVTVNSGAGWTLIQTANPIKSTFNQSLGMKSVLGGAITRGNVALAVFADDDDVNPIFTVPSPGGGTLTFDTYFTCRANYRQLRYKAKSDTATGTVAGNLWI